MSAFEEIRTYEIFHACSDEFVRTLAQQARRVTVPKGTLILKEGELNDRLRILANGIVEVRVNNEKVAMLVQPGDLMGEISALAGRPVTASLFAYTEEVAFFEIMASNLDDNIKSSPSDFGYRLYAV